MRHAKTWIVEGKTMVFDGRDSFVITRDGDTFFETKLAEFIKVDGKWVFSKYKTIKK